MNSNSNKLIITADDFGLCESVNEAIIDSYLNNNITNTSILINMPHSIKSIDLLKKYKINYGLHFSINRGIPFNKKSSLCDSTGNFLSRKDLFKKILVGKVKKQDILNEFNSQLDLCNSYGLKVTHFDSDNHTHFHPYIFSAIKESALLKGLSFRSFRPLFYNIYFPKRFLRQILFYYGDKLLSIFAKNRLFTNNFFCSPYDVQDSFELTEKLYFNILKNIKFYGVTELMVHPYYNSTELKKYYPYKISENFLQNCFCEAQILTSRKNLFKDYDIETDNFYQLRLDFLKSL